MRCVFETKKKKKEGFTDKSSKGCEGMRGLPRAKDPRQKLAWYFDDHMKAHEPE